MEQAALLWLVVLVVLIALFLLTLRRLSVLVGRTRSLERYQKLTRQLADRLAATADPFVTQLDEIRRRSGDPRSLAEAMPGAQDALRAIADEGRGAKVPRGLAQARRRRSPSSWSGPSVPPSWSATGWTRSSRTAGVATSRPRRRSSAARSTCATRPRPSSRIVAGDRRGPARGPAHPLRPGRTRARSSVPTYIVDGDLDDRLLRAAQTSRRTPYVVVSSRYTTTGCGCSRLEGRCAVRIAGPVTRGSSTPGTWTSRRSSAVAASARRARTRFTTYERVEAARLIVVKRDGDAPGVRPRQARSTACARP